MDCQKGKKEKNLQVLEMSFSCFKPFGVWGVTEAVSRGMEHRNERPEWERAEDEKWEVRELQTEDDIGFCCFCPNGAFCTFYYYFGQMVHFTPFFFFFQFRLESINWRGYRWLPSIRTNSARIGTDQPNSARVGMSRETKKKIINK